MNMITKKKIVIVDDDFYFTQTTKERLVDAGFEVVTANSVSAAKTAIAGHSDADAVVLDIMLPPDGESDLDTQMGYKSGLVLARWVKQNYPTLKIVGVSGVKSLDVTDWFEQQRIPLFEKGSGEFIEGLNRILHSSELPLPIKTFIVHGRDERTKYEVKNYLQNTLNLPEPVILHEQPSLGRTIIEKFEDVARQVDLVFVLITPDDIAVADEGLPNDVKRRARQNVIFEMGYFFGKLPRKKGRVLCLYKGTLELPTDIQGLIYVDITEGVDHAGEVIRRELSALGYQRS